ncbi:TetR/AcrR family transcriptional regulator [Brachybacterium saurashtrense]|uniref:TetR/AcrR family transcriptional regulator n=1 Tax=Brachybacterium saurashtrense TaxID=556288 RepID=A0A345YSI6_9MICO|nr:TetR/AcrR family transcriptional regulator [Brachybacterium saurashtrense]AXK46888.1 TetR/AcrR family transcriptional regulator [Brachybacterium saurashtrense]RRR22603.1 TetR/AcrR family transcriptional regulator [Brachybacterium saurashtrense]
MSARDALLDAYQAILQEAGERATTLTAVAARAGVSKGGLLYHFSSKEALAEGLIARLDQLVEEDLLRMRAAPDGPSRYYVRTSVWTGDPLATAIVATAQLAQESHAAAQEAMLRARRQWFALILDEAGEEATAQAILLLGDGLYFEAAMGYDTYSPDAPDQPADPGTITPEKLLPIVDRLLRAAGG